MSFVTTPIYAPKPPQTVGAKTVSSGEARERALAAFNQSLTTNASPSEPGAVLTPPPVTERPNPPTIEASSDLPDEGPKPDTPPPPSSSPASDPDETKKIAAHYANLARREKLLRQREQALRTRERPPSSHPAAANPPSFDASNFVNKQDLVKDPFGVLSTLGLTYEQLTQKALDAPSHEELQRRNEVEGLKSELKSLRDTQEQVKNTFTESQAQARRQAEMQIRQDVSRLVQNDPLFEVTRANNASHEVARLITAVFDDGMGPEYPPGTILNIEDAASMVEKELTERAVKTARLQKIQSQLKSTSPAKKQENTQQHTNPGLRTLTNGIGTQTRKMTPRERALAAFRGEPLGGQ